MSKIHLLAIRYYDSFKFFMYTNSNSLLRGINRYIRWSSLQSLQILYTGSPPDTVATMETNPRRNLSSIEIYVG